MTREKQPAERSFWNRVFENWRALETWFMTPIVLFYVGYKVVQQSSKIEVALVNGAIAAVSISAVLFVLAMLMVPLTRLDDRRLENWVQQQDVLHLLGFVYSAVTPESWKRGCDAIVRIGPLAAPTLMYALDPSAEVVRNPLGKALESNANLRAGAAYCLGGLRETKAVAALIPALCDTEWVVRKYTCDALAELGAGNGRAILEHAAPMPGVGSMGLLSEGKVQARLEQLAGSDDQPAVRQAAKAALEKLGATISV